MKVTVYHTTNCAFCKTEMQWLDSKGVEYNHVNLDEDEPSRLWMTTALDLHTVPVTIITSEDKTDVVLGFDRPKLSSAIGIY